MTYDTTARRFSDADDALVAQIDRTPKIARSLGINVLNHGINLLVTENVSPGSGQCQ